MMPSAPSVNMSSVKGGMPLPGVLVPPPLATAVGVGAGVAVASAVGVATGEGVAVTVGVAWELAVIVIILSLDVFKLCSFTATTLTP